MMFSIKYLLKYWFIISDAFIVAETFMYSYAVCYSFDSSTCIQLFIGTFISNNKSYKNQTKKSANFS